jgi:hypothetical protein
MTRYILICVSLLIAASEFNFGNPSGSTVTGRLLASLTYAFAPLIFALLLLGLFSGISLVRKRGHTSTFSSDLNWTWGVLLLNGVTFEFGAEAVRA